MVFAAIAVLLFVRITYFFRHFEPDAAHVTGIRQEYGIDLVYVGGSAAFVYWQPQEAWNNYGFASYNFATNTLQAEAVEHYIRYVERFQDPSLYVVDLRPFQYWDYEEFDDSAIRRSTVAMSIFAPEAYGLYNDYFKNRQLPEDFSALEYYFDIAKYHTNLEKLGEEKSWNNRAMEAPAAEHGWEWFNLHAPMKIPEDFMTEERVALHPNCENILRSLLSYCEEEKLNVLFVVCPYYITEEHQKIYNSLSDIIAEYGFDYLNSNEYYHEICLDFSTDFYNKNHVNPKGAVKYTRFLGKYIKDKFELIDHSQEPGYEKWNLEQDLYEKKMEDAERTIDEKIEYARTVADYSETLRNTDDVNEWLSLVSNPVYHLVFAYEGRMGLPPGSEAVLLNEAYEYPQGELTLAVKTFGNWDLNEGESDISGILDEWGDTRYEASYDGERISVLINGEEQAKDGDGISIVVFDSLYRELVDSILLTVVDGKFAIER